MSILVQVRDWDTWPLEPAGDIRNPIKMWYSDISSPGDASGGAHTVSFIIAEAGDPAADGVEAVGNMFGIIEAAVHVSTPSAGDLCSLLLQSWTVLPGATQQDRAYTMSVDPDAALLDAGVISRDRLRKVWLGHRVKNTPGLLIFTILNQDNEEYIPSIWLCEWTPEAYQRGGPVWPALAG